MNQSEGNGAVLIVVGDASETLDTLYPYYRLRESGFEPVPCGPEARRYQMVLHGQPASWDVTLELEGYSIQARMALSDVDPERYVGLYLSGGRAPEYLRYDEHLLRLTRHFFESGKPVAGVCHGALIAARAGCLEGRRLATVPKCRFDLEVVGAEFVDEPCVVDGNLYSGRTYEDCGPFVGAWVRALEDAS